MYVLQLSAEERDYLLSLLKTRRSPHARLLAGQLKTGDDVFGITMWCDDDIKSKLEECDVPATPENIEKVRHSYYGRHLEDLMIERGWVVLEDAVLELKH